MPAVANDFIESVTDLGFGIFQVVTHLGVDITAQDPALFTSPSAGAVGVSLSNIPVGNTLQFDLAVASGDTWDYAGSPGFDPGSGVIV